MYCISFLVEWHHPENVGVSRPGQRRRFRLLNALPLQIVHLLQYVLLLLASALVFHAVILQHHRSAGAPYSPHRERFSESKGRGSGKRDPQREERELRALVNCMVSAAEGVDEELLCFLRDLLDHGISPNIGIDQPEVMRVMIICVLWL